MVRIESLANRMHRRARIVGSNCEQSAPDNVSNVVSIGITPNGGQQSVAARSASRIAVVLGAKGVPWVESLDRAGLNSQWKLTKNSDEHVDIIIVETRRKICVTLGEKSRSYKQNINKTIWCLGLLVTLHRRPANGMIAGMELPTKFNGVNR